MSESPSAVNRQIAARYASLADAAAWYGLSQRSIRRLIASGDLKAYRVGKRQIRIRISDLEALARPIPSAAS